MLQLRFKSLDVNELTALSRQVCAVVHSAGGLLIVNDSVEAALHSGADGVHLGEHDTAAAEARAQAPGLVIGATARTPEMAQRAAAAGADYLGSGSVYGSATKPGLPLIGLDGLQMVAEAVELPVTAIGGIDAANCRDVMQTGAAGFTAIAPFRTGRPAAEVIEELLETCGHNRAASIPRINITVNGRLRQVDANATGAALLAELGLPASTVVAELNGTIIERTELERHVFADGDVLELLTIVGGG